MPQKELTEIKEKNSRREHGTREWEREVSTLTYRISVSKKHLKCLLSCYRGVGEGLKLPSCLLGLSRKETFFSIVKREILGNITAILGTVTTSKNLMCIPNHQFSGRIKVHHLETSIFNRLNSACFSFSCVLINVVRSLSFINLLLLFR